MLRQARSVLPSLGRRSYSEASPGGGFDVQKFITRIDALTKAKPATRSRNRGPRPDNKAQGTRRADGKQMPQGGNGQSIRFSRSPDRNVRSGERTPKPPAVGAETRTASQGPARGTSHQSSFGSQRTTRNNTRDDRNPSKALGSGPSTGEPRAHTGQSASSNPDSSDVFMVDQIFSKSSTLEEGSPIHRRRGAPKRRQAGAGISQRPRRATARPQSGGKGAGRKVKKRQSSEEKEEQNTAAANSEFLSADDALRLVIRDSYSNSDARVKVSPLGPSSIAPLLVPSAVTYNTRIWSALNVRDAQEPDAARIVARNVSGEYKRDMLPDANALARALDSNGSLSISHKQFISSVAAGEITLNKLQGQAARQASQRN